MAPNGLERALGRLDPEDRALLELSLRRRVADGALAELLRLEPRELSQRREAALDRLQIEGGWASRAEVEDELVRHWRRRAQEGPGEARHEPERRPARRVLPVALAAAATAAAIGVLALVGDGDDGRESGSPGRTQPLGAAKRGPVVPLQAVGPGRARGTAQLVRRGERSRLRVEITRLPGRRAAHAVWLYDSLADARRLAGFETVPARLELRLPAGFERFRLVDVSEEPPDRNPNHSGASVLRVELERLLPRR